MKQKLHACLLSLAMISCGTAAMAAWPEKPIRLVVPYAPASATDTIARQIMPKLAAELGVSIVIDNKGGASGIIGAQDVAKAPADGYTLLFGGIQTHAINASLYDKLPYDPIRDFAPVARLDTQPLLLAVSSKLGVKTVAELIAYAKANPGKKLSYASTGAGTSAHLANESLNRAAGVKFLHVPYRSVPQALVDLSNNDITMFFYTYSPLVPFMQKGTVNVLATTNRVRMAVLPNVPTMAEVGYPTASISAWQALYAPAGTPRDILEKISRAAFKAMNDPQLTKLLNDTGSEVWLGTIEETIEFTRAETERMGEVVRMSGAKAN